MYEGPSRTGPILHREPILAWASRTADGARQKPSAQSLDRANQESFQAVTSLRAQPVNSRNKPAHRAHPFFDHVVVVGQDCASSQASATVSAAVVIPGVFAGSTGARRFRDEAVPVGPRGIRHKRSWPISLPLR